MQIIHLKNFFFKLLLSFKFWHHQKKFLLTFLESPLNKLSEKEYFHEGSITFSSQGMKKNILMGKKKVNIFEKDVGCERVNNHVTSVLGDKFS